MTAQRELAAIYDLNGSSIAIELYSQIWPEVNSVSTN